MIDSIENGVLKKKEGNMNSMVEYTMGYLDVSHIDEMMDLKEYVKSNIENAEIFTSASSEIIIEDVLKPGRGAAIGVFVQGQLISYRSLKFCGKIINSTSRKLDIPEEEMDQVIYLQATVVHPDYRGNGLQVKTLMQAFDVARERNFKHMTSTISPYNYYSLRNILNNKITIRELVTLGGNYGNRKRFILYRNLTEVEEKVYKDISEVDYRDMEGHINILEKGYIGFDSKKNKQGFSIIYGIEE